MKPRTRNEREVEQLRHSLSVRQSDVDWIEKRHKKGQTEYFAIYEKKGDWQVIRMFMYRSWTKQRECLHEPLRYWLKADGSCVLESKKRQCLGNYYIDAWNIRSELEIRSFGGSRDVRNLLANCTRIHSLIPELKRARYYANNICVNGLMPFWLVQSILQNNRIETFFKLRQTWLTYKFYHYETRRLTDSMWQAIRVALRHGYHWDNKQEINDWVDMIDDLEYLGIDTHNPHYICPANLQEAHTFWNERRRRMAEARRKQEEIKQILAYEPTFKENRERFFGMVFTDKKIEVQIIPTAIGIHEEGEAMHHCVGCYYNRTNSLILSAKIGGKRIETIEVNLTDYTLVQSRGLQNKATRYHQRICKLVRSNMQEIIKRNTKAA